MINSNTKIEEVVKIDGKMMDYFNNNNIDYCCNGHMTLEELSEEKDINVDKLIEDINKELDILSNVDGNRGIDLEDFKKLSFEEMINSLVNTHHKDERDLLFDIDKMLNKIMLVHFENHGEDLLKLHSLFGSLKSELEEHFVKEEKVTFPLMIENPNPSDEIIKRVEELEEDHEKAGNIIKEMIDLTDWFKAPDDGCNTFIRTYRKLDELVKDVFVHIFKENSILFLKYKER